jgi:hypothetical protein
MTIRKTRPVRFAQAVAFALACLPWLAASRGAAGEADTPAEPRGKGTVTFK